MKNRLDYAFQVSSEAYKQQVEREKTIRTKSEYLIKWITIFISVFNIAIPIIVKEIDFDYRNVFFVILYSVLMGGLIVAMLCLLLLDYPQKVKCHPLGHEILKNDKFRFSQENSDFEIIYNNILIQDSITKRLSQNNDNAVRNLKIANLSIIVAIVALATLFVHMVCSV